MKRLGSRRHAAGAVVLGGLVAAVVAVASAQAAPSKKNFTVQVAVTNDAVSHQDFTVKVKNDGSSNTTLGSANLTLPTGFTADTATPSLAGWVAGTSIVNDGNGTSTIQLRSATAGDALTPGQTMDVAVHVATPAALPTTCTDGSWSSTAKQSNDYNGTNNSFTLLTGQSDMDPLGSFEITDITTPILVAPFSTPAILLQPYTSTTTAYDTCHNPKQTYTGAALTYHGLTGTTSKSFDPSGGQTLNWTKGVGTVTFTPVISETGNTITVTDPPTQISDPSKPFDTQQKICNQDTSPCAWQNGNGSISASAPKPAQGSLGVGFNPNVKFSGDCSGDALGKTMITIAPHDTDGSDYQVTLVYQKSVSGTGNANTFIVCASTDGGSSFHVLQACSTYPSPVPPAQLPDCVVDQKRITGGALQIILNLDPADPYVGGR